MAARRGGQGRDAAVQALVGAALAEVQRSKDPISTAFELARRMRVKSPSEVRVDAAMVPIRRVDFLPEDVKPAAGMQQPLPIGYGQTSTAPEVIKFMLEKLDVQEGMIVLEIGTGCGYQTAILATLVGRNGRVITIEIIPEFFRNAQASMKKYGFGSIEFVLGSGARGYEAEAPYDRIIYSAAASKFPKKVMTQLKVGGILLVHVQGAEHQMLILARRTEKGIEKTNLGPIANFVHLVED